MTLGERIKQRREEKGITAVELARRAEISKGYVSQARGWPGFEPIRHDFVPDRDDPRDYGGRLAGRGDPAGQHRYSSWVARFCQRSNLPEQDVRMLAKIRFRGEQPRDKDDWRFLYESIRRSIGRGT